MQEVSNDPASDALPEAPRWMTTRGLGAIVAGEVAEVAYELVGPVVAVRAVWAALVGRAVDGAVIREGQAFYLPYDRRFRYIETELARGIVSSVLLSEDAIFTSLARGARDAGRKRGVREVFVHVYARSSVATPEDRPADFIPALRAVAPVPVKSEWADALWTRGRAHGVIQPRASTGSILGVQLTSDVAAWLPVLQEIIVAERGGKGSGHEKRVRVTHARGAGPRSRTKAP